MDMKIKPVFTSAYKLKIEIWNVFAEFIYAIDHLTNN